MKLNESENNSSSSNFNKLTKMKFVIVLACLLALTLADDKNVNVLRNDAEVNPDGFKYAYEFDNSIKAQQEGKLHGEEDWKVSGEYEYISPEGKTIKVTYTADESGYHPVVHN